MSSPAASDISQNDAEMLEEQRREMQRRHEEEQQSLLRLQKAAEARCAERAAQKARREVEAKAKKEAERQRVAEKEERKKRTVEYLQRLRDEVLEEEAALLEGAERSQVAGQDILYLGSSSIITEAEAGFVLLGKRLDIAGSSIDT